MRSSLRYKTGQKFHHLNKCWRTKINKNICPKRKQPGRNQDQENESVVSDVLRPDFSQGFLLDKTVDNDEKGQSIKYAQNGNQDDPER
jgi:hypothetical protein